MATYGFTGTRRGMTARQKLALCYVVRAGDTFHHGDCIGADHEANLKAKQCLCITTAHPALLPDNLRAFSPSDNVRPAKPPLERNRDIVDESEVLIAAPLSLDEEMQSGTWMTIRYARKLGKPVIILEP